MTASETPLSFEDLIGILSEAEIRLRRMRQLGQQPTVSSLVVTLLDEAKVLHAKRMNLDKVMAAGRAAAERASRTMPAPPTVPFRKESQ